MCGCCRHGAYGIYMCEHHSLFPLSHIFANNLENIIQVILRTFLIHCANGLKRNENATLDITKAIVRIQ